MAVEKAPRTQKPWPEWRYTQDGRVMDANDWVTKAERVWEKASSPRALKEVSKEISKRTLGENSSEGDINDLLKLPQQDSPKDKLH